MAGRAIPSSATPGGPPRHPGEGLADGDPADAGHRAAPHGHQVDPLDPMWRQVAALGSQRLLEVPAGASRDAVADIARGRMSVEELLPLLVRRIAWSADRERGTARLELGAGAYAGTTVIVHADGSRVRVELGGSGDLDGLQRKIEARLRRCGLDVESAL